MTLDPKAVEAVAEALEDSYGPYGDDWIHEATAAITAYIAHIEPQLRERVKEIDNCATRVRGAERRLLSYINRAEGEWPDELAAKYDMARKELVSAQAALYALFGLEAE